LTAREAGRQSEFKSRTPADEVGEQLQAGGLALFRMKLDGEDVIPGYGTGKGRAIDAACGAERAIRRRRIVAVHEVKAAARADSGPQSMRFVLQHFVPAHVRDLEAAHFTRAREARHLAAEHAEPARIAFFAMFEQHLQAEPDAEVGRGRESLSHSLPRA